MDFILDKIGYLNKNSRVILIIGISIYKVSVFIKKRFNIEIDTKQVNFKFRGIWYIIKIIDRVDKQQIKNFFLEYNIDGIIIVANLSNKNLISLYLSTYISDNELSTVFIK